MTTILKDIGLDQVATGAQTATIAEPSLACSGRRMILTGNWFSSRSTNGGKNWTFVDPYTELPQTDAGFCCDQLVRYSKKWRMWIWLLQFAKAPGGNLVRVAVSATGKPGTWTFWDTKPRDLDPGWTNVWLDYPDMMETHAHLLLSFNIFSVTTDRWQGAVVIRLPLEQLKKKVTLTRRAWSTARFGSLRFARGRGSTAHFASLDYAAPKLMVFQWKDQEREVDETLIPVGDWNDGPYLSTLPDGSPWLNRLDDRITGGWRANDDIGFAWSASADQRHAHPFVRVVRLGLPGLALKDEPDLWSSDRAWAYPAMAVNQKGEVGVTAFCGGEGNYPTHGVGWLDGKKGQWEMALGTPSTHAPINGVWGDYVDIQAHPSRRTYWMASAFSLQDGITRNHVRPRVVVFKP